MSKKTIGETLFIDHIEYQVEGIKEGGMGVVYLLESLVPVHSPTFSKYLAAKMFKAEIPLKQVVNELNIWLDLHHKNILPLLSIDTIDYQTVALSPWRLNGSLHDLLAGRGNLPPTYVKRILADAVSALEYAWDKKRILHLDIKPQNLLLSSAPWKNIEVADWGIAKIASQTEITRAGTMSPRQVHMASSFSGTLPYMSPERFLSDRDPGIESDVFSMGMVAVECLTGALPFRAEHISLTHQILSGAYFEQLAGLTHSLSEDWQDFIQKCLQYDSNRRFTSYAAIQNAIQRLGEK